MKTLEKGTMERELTYKERYDIWFRNNYETGMEKNYEIVPDFDNPYYEPTPTKIEVCKCGGKAEELHTCPYAEDVNNDETSLCNCCERCQHECCQDI